MKLHIGGVSAKDEWKILNIQPIDKVDFIGTITDLSQFDNESVSEVYASHVFEHVLQKDALSTLQGIHRILKPLGKLYLSVPDLDILCQMRIPVKVATYSNSILPLVPAESSPLIPVGPPFQEINPISTIHKEHTMGMSWQPLHVLSLTMAFSLQFILLAKEALRTGLTNLNTPISEFSAILIGLIGQKVERANGKTTKTYPLT